MKTVLITGTSRGIGKATATLFAEKGWKVIAHARKQTAEFETYCKEIDATPIYFDMTDAVAMKAAFRECIFVPKLTIDALVNNAGIAHGGLFQMMSVSRIREVFEVNLFAHMELTQLILKRMPPQGGSIVNVASVAGVVSRRGDAAYGVSKAALIAWTNVLATELFGKVRVNAVAPGLSDTDMARGDSSFDKVQNCARIGKPEEIAEAIYFLSSENASFINGDTLVVDGGIESRRRLYVE